MIKYLILDVDGTLTDGKVYMGNAGELMKAFHIRDGYGIKNLAIPSGIVPIILTSRLSKIVENRCKELGITQIFQGIEQKDVFLNSIVDNLSQVAYIGDDLNDLVCMSKINEAGGLTGCPKDAEAAIVNVAKYVCGRKGGEGAVREFIEFLISDHMRECETR